MSGEAIVLLAGLLLAHCAGDFSPLATDRMHEAKGNGGPLIVIAAHAGVHAVLVTAVIALLAPGPVWTILAAAAFIEFVTHFGLDAGRARLARRFPALNDLRRRAFWYVLGLDQFAHALVLVGLAAFALGSPA